MPNATVRADARTMSDAPVSEDEEKSFDRERFEAAYSEYLAAKAGLYAPFGDNDIPDASRRRMDAAKQALLSTPAIYGWMLMQKWEVVESGLAAEAEGDRPIYPITILGLAALKADVLAIGLKA